MRTYDEFIKTAGFTDTMKNAHKFVSDATGHNYRKAKRNGGSTADLLFAEVDKQFARGKIKDTPRATKKAIKNAPKNIGRFARAKSDALKKYVDKNPGRAITGAALIGTGLSAISPIILDVTLVRKKRKAYDKKLKQLKTVEEREKRQQKQHEELIDAIKGSSKTAHEFLDEMVKSAAYLKDIDCEQCGFKGKPDPDGTCPECGAIGGHKAYGVQKRYEPTLEDIENSKNTADDDYREEQENIHSMIMGG